MYSVLWQHKKINKLHSHVFVLASVLHIKIHKKCGHMKVHTFLKNPKKSGHMKAHNIILEFVPSIRT
jgi:hypothetical protein